MLVSKKKYQHLQMMKNKDEIEYRCIISEMRQAAREERELVAKELVEDEALLKLNEDLECNDLCVLGIERNEIGDFVAVTIKRNDKLSVISLFSLKNNNKEDLCERPSVEVTSNLLNRELKIEDTHLIENLDRNGSGNGTILLDYLKKEAKRNRFISINGNLGNVNQKNYNDVEKFYENNDFDVSLSKDQTSGSIKFIL